MKTQTEEKTMKWETIDSYKEITGKAGNWFSGYIVTYRVIYVQLFKHCGFIRKI